MLIREEVFCSPGLTFLLSSCSSQRDTHSPLSQDKGFKKKVTLQTSLMSCKKRKSKQKKKADISIKALYTTSSAGSVYHRHMGAPWAGWFPPTLG